MKTKLLISFLFILILSSISNAVTFPDTLDSVTCTAPPRLNATFEYSDAYTNHEGWDAFYTTTFPPIPPNTPYKNSSFGYNGSYSAVDFFHRLDFFDSVDYTTGIFLISFDIYQGYDNVTSGGNYAYYFPIVNTASVIQNSIKISGADNPTNHEFLGCVPNVTINNNIPYHIDVLLDLSTDKSSVYVNNLDVGCNNINGTVASLGGIEAMMFHTAHEGSDRQIDNILICQATYTGNYTAGVSDTSDLAVAIESFWEQVGIKSTGSRLIIGLLILLGIAWAYLMAHIGAKVPITSGSGVGLVVIEIIATILLVYIQLLPVWFLFLMIFLAGGIAFLVFKSTMSSGG